MNKIPFREGQLVFRNTWKNMHGNIRTNLYGTEERARLMAANCPGNLFQEIATPVHQSQCLIPGERYENG